MDSIFKYFGSKEHLDNFLNLGEVYFNSLSYFLACEDSARRDGTEDLNVFRPAEGLQIHNQTTNESYTEPHLQLNSRIPKPDRVFVFCASTDLSKKLSKKFKAEGCVQVVDLQEFKKRLLSQLELFWRNQGQSGCYLDGPVEYYDPAAPPGTRHAWPEQIIMSKPAEDFILLF